MIKAIVAIRPMAFLVLKESWYCFMTRRNASVAEGEEPGSNLLR